MSQPRKSVRSKSLTGKRSINAACPPAKRTKSVTIPSPIVMSHGGSAQQDENLSQAAPLHSTDPHNMPSTSQGSSSLRGQELSVEVSNAINQAVTTAVQSIVSDIVKAVLSALRQDQTSNTSDNEDASSETQHIAASAVESLADEGLSWLYKKDCNKMAGCYHDKHDFKSDLNIEVAREGDLLEAGQDLKDRKCAKNPGHRGFIPFKDLTLEHLPIEDRNRETLDNIKKMGSRVVRLVVDKIKNGKQRKIVGTGVVLREFNGTYFIGTNNHVVGTEDELKRCTVEFHYDDDSTSSVITSRGVKLFHTCPYRDVTKFTFDPVPDFSHQIDFVYFPSTVIMYKDKQIVIVTTLISGESDNKLLSELDINSSLIDLMFISWHDGSISYLKSCYFTFKPIPSNIQLLTFIQRIVASLQISIEIHIDEDDGNSRVIPGDVVKFGDEFVVKISESIFQDEVKKCRLVWNGEVFGRGTRLYFQQVKTSDIYSGISLEIYIETGRENFWIFEIHPTSRYLEAVIATKNKETSNLCCIGHPHGGIKMVTFGRALGESTERFDNQYRRINQPDKECQCKEVHCLNYTCKTCPGSSGSPVFTLCEWNNLNAHAFHFMSKRESRILPDGELVENINMAWCG